MIEKQQETKGLDGYTAKIVCTFCGDKSHKIMFYTLPNFKLDDLPRDTLHRIHYKNIRYREAEALFGVEEIAMPYLLHCLHCQTT